MKLRQFITLALIALVIAVLHFGASVQPVSAGTQYYVATNGNDSWSGTLPAPNGGNTDGPFRTIQRCATVVTAGSNCAIRTGVYRETVTPANSGSAGLPITFQAYNNEDVTISGADVVTGWTTHDLAGGRAIYKAPMSWSMNVRNVSGVYQVTNNQIFVNGAMMPEAQYPNIAPDAVTHMTNAMHMRATGVANLAQYSATYITPQLAAYPTNYWVGAKINLSPGSTIFWGTCDVTASTSNSVSFTCNPDPAAWGARSPLDGIWTTPLIGNYFYLWGKYDALDAAGEWFRDSVGTLYLWTPDGANPASRTIEARRRAWGLELSNRAYITVKGVKLFAAGINTSATTNNVLITEIEARYLWHMQELPVFGYTSGIDAIRFEGSDNTLSDSFLAYSAGPLYTQGGKGIYGPKTSGNRFINNVGYDMSYMGTAPSIGGGIVGNNGTGATFHKVQQNTLWNSGYYTVNIGPGVSIDHNDAYQSHLQISDLGTMYNWNTDALGAEVAYNYVHDNYAEVDNSLLKYGGHGIYLDDYSDNSVIHHNITWSTTSPGIFVFGKDLPGPGHRKIYNNTVDGVLSAGEKSDQTLIGTEYRNNIAMSFGLTNPNLSLSNNLLGEGGWVNRFGRDYGLRNDSVALNQGGLLPPYTDGYTGAAPDQGALEYGRIPFVAGALVRERDLAGLQASCEPNFPGTTATCTITNLPLGRKLANEFQLKIGTAGVAQNCLTPMNYLTNQGVGICKSVPTGGLSGVQPISVHLNGGWVTLGSTVDLGGLAIFTVAPGAGTTAGGTSVTLTGRRFNYLNGASYRTPITISNTSGANLSTYQVAVQFNSAALIAAGKMRSDCGDLRFTDAYGTLSYWLEEGCNTAATRAWVKVLAIPTGGATIYMTYGNPSLTSASSGSETFVYFPDLSSGTVDPALALDTASGISVTQTGGQLRVTGSTNSGNQYGQWGFRVQTWKVAALPVNYAVDATLSVVSGPASFKGAAGTYDLSFFGGTLPKKIGYYNSGWIQLGTSTVNSALFNNQKLSAGTIKNASDYTVRWFENGAPGVLASRTVASTNMGAFNYGPDTIASFDARYANVRIRQFAFPEPTVSVGAEVSSLVRFSFGGTACQNVVATNYTQATCLTPPHTAGRVNIVATNPDGATFTFDGFTYGSRPDTIGLFDKTTGQWLLRNSNTSGAADTVLYFGGSPNHLPITGDWNGDGVDTVGIYDTSMGVFQLRDINTTGGAEYYFVLGNPGDTPMAGRWDNTMTHDGAGVYRNANGILYLRKQLTTGFSDYYMVLGNPGDAGMAGDWNGDGIDSVGVYRPSLNHVFLSNINGNGITFSDIDLVFGDPAARHLAADWNATGISTIGYFKNGVVSLRYSLTNGGADYTFNFGAAGLLPVAGKWTSGSLPSPLTNILVGANPAQPDLTLGGETGAE